MGCWELAFAGRVLARDTHDSWHDSTSRDATTVDGMMNSAAIISVPRHVTATNDSLTISLDVMLDVDMPGWMEIRRGWVEIRVVGGGNLG